MPIPTHKERVGQAVSAVASSGLGAATLGAALADYKALAAGDDGKYGDYLWKEGSSWEINRGCVYTHTGTSLSRGTLVDSSTGSAIAFTSAVQIYNVPTAYRGQGWDNAQPGQISGLVLEWVSSSSIKIKSGAAFIGSADRVMAVPSDITLSGLTGLTANTLYHAYVYDNAGTPAAEISTTAPATPFIGTARSKTGDTTRRYLGSVRTDGAGAIHEFQFLGGGSQCAHIYRNVDATTSPWRLLNGAAKATTAQSLSFASIAPANVTTEVFACATLATGVAGQNGDLIFGLANNATTRIAAIANNVPTTSTYPNSQFWLPVVPATPLVYWYNLASSGANVSYYLDVTGYRFER